MSKRLSVAEYHEDAKRVLPKLVYDYYRSGARDEISLRWNEECFQRIKLLPRFLTNVSEVTTKVTIFGQLFETPIFIAPTAMQKMGHADGEKAMYRAAQKAGSLFTLSSLSTTRLEDVAKSASSTRWFQLYVAKNRDFTKALLKRVEAAGFTAVVLTVDTPILGVREADVRNKFHLPYGLQIANFDEYANSNCEISDTVPLSGLGRFFHENIDPSLTWKDVEWLVKQTSLPVLAKGVMAADDAVLALRAGVAGIIVSNHGARQLDTVPATIEVLPSIVEAVQGKVPVFVDGGIRRGTDALKALAFGAKAVFVGRPVLWGLSVGGEDGVLDVLNLLRAELEQSMKLAGVRSIEEISRKVIFDESKSIIPRAAL